MHRVRPALLLAVLLLSACATVEPRPLNAYANWLAEKPRTVRIVLDAPAEAPSYSVEWRNVAQGAMDGASFGILLSALVVGGMSDSCETGCADAKLAIVGGAAVIGGLIGGAVAPVFILPGRPLEDFRVTRALVPVMQLTRRDIVRRAAESFAANLRRKGGHVVNVVVAATPWYEPVDSEITVVASSIGLTGPEPRARGRASLRIMVEVRARWRGNARKQRFHYRSEVLDLSDWANREGEEAGQAARLAFSNLAGRMFTALAEP